MIKVAGSVKTKVYTNADGYDDKFEELCAVFHKTISMKGDVAVDILKGSTIVGCMFPDPLSNKMALLTILPKSEYKNHYNNMKKSFAKLAKAASKHATTSSAMSAISASANHAESR